MVIIPVPVAGDHKTGSLTGYSVEEIREILGFDCNVQDDPDKVSHSWGFLADGRQCGIWSYKGSEQWNTFSCYGPKEVFDELFAPKS
jgi:hypothetical protein